MSYILRTHVTTCRTFMVSLQCQGNRKWRWFQEAVILVELGKISLAPLQSDPWALATGFQSLQKGRLKESECKGNSTEDLRAFQCKSKKPNSQAESSSRPLKKLLQQEWEWRCSPSSIHGNIGNGLLNKEQLFFSQRIKVWAGDDDCFLRGAGQAPKCKGEN